MKYYRFVFILFLFFEFSAPRLFAQEDSTGFICRFPEIPSYPGGEAALAKFLQENIRYPDSAKQNGIEGTVYIEFTIDTNGVLDNFTVRRGIADYPAFGEEAIRVLKLSSPWLPGKGMDKTTKVRFTQPVRFSLDKKAIADTCYCGNCKAENSLDEIFVFSEQMPEYPGGEAAKMKFLYKNLQLPKNLERKGGTVYVSFVVLADGSLVNIKPARPADANDELTIAVVETFCKMPQWKAGQVAGHKVNVRMTEKLIIDLQ